MLERLLKKDIDARISITMDRTVKNGTHLEVKSERKSENATPYVNSRFFFNPIKTCSPTKPFRGKSLSRHLTRLKKTRLLKPCKSKGHLTLWSRLVYISVYAAGAMMAHIDGRRAS